MRLAGTCAPASPTVGLSTCVSVLGMRIGCAPWTPTSAPVAPLVAKPICSNAEKNVFVRHNNVVHNLMNFTDSWEGSLRICRHFVCGSALPLSRARCMYWAQVIFMSVMRSVDGCNLGTRLDCLMNVHHVPPLQCAWKSSIIRDLCPRAVVAPCSDSGGVEPISIEFQYMWVRYLFMVWSACAIAVFLSVCCCISIKSLKRRHEYAILLHPDRGGRVFGDKKPETVVSSADAHVPLVGAWFFEGPAHGDPAG